ncbi:MAG TPA: hypothetical protein VHW23_34365 [Kofleriaceae bacterium]|jgi:hypothetical protein|nr:hypothetical protein [Kofleriaceae bacterium]
MPTINVHHAAFHIKTSGPLGDPVDATLPDGTTKKYRPQVGISGVDAVMRSAARDAWERGGTRYIQVLVDLLCAQIAVAAGNIPNSENALLVFNAPEFLFKDSPRHDKSKTVYGPPFPYDAFYNGMEYLKRKLLELCDGPALGHRTLLLCGGTVWWYQPDHATGQAIVHNTAPVFDSSSRRMYHLEKHSASRIDGLHVNASEVWDRETESTAAIWAQVDALHPQEPVVVRPKAGGELRAGIEICLDFINGRLARSLASTGTTVDLQVVTACGAPYRPDSTSYCGRLFLRCDGMAPDSTTATVHDGHPDDGGAGPQLHKVADGVAIAIYPSKAITV